MPVFIVKSNKIIHQAFGLIAGKGACPMALTIRPTREQDQPWVRALMIDRWGAETVVAHEVVYHPHRLPGFVACLDGRIAGLVTYLQQQNECEIVTLDSLVEGAGIGTALIQAVIGQARQSGCARVWLITTNDNLNALGFYQKRGFRLVKVNPGAVDRSRQVKPEIPLIGAGDIPIHDEIEMEVRLQD